MHKKRIANWIVATILVISIYSSAYASAMQDDMSYENVAMDTDKEISELSVTNVDSMANEGNLDVNTSQYIKRSPEANYSTIEWVYLWDNKLKVGSKVVTVRSAKLIKAKEGDTVSLKIKWNINSFSIIDVTINWNVIVPDKVVMKSATPARHYSGDFTINGLYKNWYLHMEDWSKIKKVKVSVKNASMYEDKQVVIKVRGTIKSFVVQSINIVK